MNRILVVSLATIALILPAGSAVAQDGKAEKGMKIYAEQKCSMCHSIAGKGNPKGTLDGVGSRLSATEIKQWLVDPAAMAERTKAERKPAMKAYGTLGAGDLDALVAYLQSLKKKE